MCISFIFYFILFIYVRGLYFLGFKDSRKKSEMFRNFEEKMDLNPGDIEKKFFGGWRSQYGRIEKQMNKSGAGATVRGLTARKKSIFARMGFIKTHLRVTGGRTGTKVNIYFNLLKIYSSIF